MRYLTMTIKAMASLAAAALLLAPSTASAGGERIHRIAAPPMPPQQMMPAAPAEKCYNAWDVVLYYIPNRVLDFIDIGRLNLGVGCGFGFNVRATELAEIGFGQYETTRFGMKGRVLPVYEENIDEAGFAFLGYVNGCLQRDPTEVGADLHVGVIGAQAAVSLAEAADFLVGFILIDLQHDDLGPNPFE
jgi:hypothetical protein